jgi:hypothetical protein
MKRNIFTISAVFVAVLWAQIVLASNLSLAKQWEERGNFAKAAEEYSMAANLTDNLNRKAELLYDVGRCRIKSGNVAYIADLVSDIKTYSSNKGASLVPKLLVQLEEFAWKAGDEEARQALSVVLMEQPARRQALSDKANAKNRKALAYWLNPALNEADCKAKRAKTLKAKNVIEIAKQLAATRDTCQATPSENEYKAFADRVITELDTMAALPLYEQMQAIWGHLDESNINVLVTYGQKIARIEGREADVERIRQILPENIVESKLMRVDKLSEGRWKALETRGGERTPNLLVSAITGRVEFASNGCSYTIVFEDGRRFNPAIQADRERFLAVESIPRFYVVAAQAEVQPKNLENGLCVVGVIISKN